jgi:ATP-dependent Clp protease protease subunit
MGCVGRNLRTDPTNRELVERFGAALPAVDEEAVEAWGKVLKDRIIFVGLPIDDTFADIFIDALRWMSRTKEPISVYLNTPGGACSSSFRLLHELKVCRCPIATVGLRMVFGTGTLLLSSGTKGRRYVLRTCSVGLGPLWGGPVIDPDALEKMKTDFWEALGQATGRSPSELGSFVGNEERRWSAEEAVCMKLADEVIDSLAQVSANE